MITPSNLLLVTDAHRSVLAERGQATRRAAYCVYGHARRDGFTGRQAFNGEYPEPAGTYLLGSHRAFSPALRRMHSPDSFSPFGQGGLNPYTYCVGDPVNHVDPTGHIPQWLLPATGVALSIAGVVAMASTGGAAVGIAAVLKKVTVGAAAGSAATAGGAVYAQYGAGDEKAGAILGHISFGLGVLSLMAGIGSGLKFKSWGKRGSRKTSRGSSTISREQRIVNAKDEFDRIGTLPTSPVTSRPRDAVQQWIEEVSERSTQRQRHLLNRPSPSPTAGSRPLRSMSLPDVDDVGDASIYDIPDNLKSIRGPI